MYDPKKLMTPDYSAPPQQDWVQFPEDDQIDIGPAAGAFKQRFMQNRGAGDMTNIPSFDYKPESMDNISDAGGGAAAGLGSKLKGLKSL